MMRYSHAKAFGLLVLLGLLASSVVAVPIQRDLVLQVDGSDVTTVIDAGKVKVSSWNDQSGRNNHLAETDVQRFPLLESAVLNGHDALRFDPNGTYDRLAISAPYAGDLVPGTGGFTIFLVMKLDSINTGRYIFRKGNYVSSVDQGWSIWTDATRVISRLNADDISDTDHKAGRTHAYTDHVGQWVVYSMVMDGTTLSTYLNGVNNYLNTWDGGTYTGSVSPNDSVYLGVLCDAHFAEVLVYKTNLTAIEQNLVGEYLADKYGLSTAYSSLSVPVDDALVLQLDGSYVSTEVSGSDTLVTAWNDRSVRGNHFLAATVDERPKLLAGALNGYDTVAFDPAGTDDNLKLDAAVADDLNPGSEGMTIFMVAKANQVGGGSYWFRKGNYVSTADQGWSIFTDTVVDGRLACRLNADDIDDDVHKAGRTHAFSGDIGSWVVYSVVMNGSTLQTALNGSTNYLNTWFGGTYTGAVSPADSAYLGLNTDAEFAEVLVYKKALAAEELDKVGGYLSYKYSLATAYPLWTPTCNVLWMSGQGRQEDFNQDCRVDLIDFAILSQQWLTNYDPEQ